MQATEIHHVALTSNTSLQIAEVSKFSHFRAALASNEADGNSNAEIGPAKITSPSCDTPP